MKPLAATHIDVRGLALKLAAGGVTAFGTAAALAYFLNEPLTSLSQELVASFGVLGLGAATLVIDSVPTPLSAVPLMLLAVKGGIPMLQVAAATIAASILAGWVGFGLGRLIGMPRTLQVLMDQRFPGKLDLLREHGVWGVAAIALLPLPFALGTWSAGALGVRTRGVLLATLLRAPKMGFYLVLIESGLSFGS